MKTTAKKTFDAVKIMREQRDKLSDNHKMAIYKAIDQIDNGDYLTTEQSNQPIGEWLNK